MEQWKGKVAIVTGASVGIGAAIVTELIKYGVNVVALARRENKLQELKESLTRNVNLPNHGIIYTKVCDVTDENAVKEVFSWVDAKLGGLSILVNNAGTAKITSLLNGKLEDWQDTFNLNVIALGVCSREAYQSMTKNKIDGHIIQINSMAGHSISPYFGFKVYNASKTALTVLCDGLRHELQLTGSKIKVSSVSPGPVQTEMLASVSSRFRDAKLIANFKILNPEDIANAVISSLSTPPNVLIAEMIVIPTGTTIQQHSQPSVEVVENILKS
ncbi:Short-chain dehydrogenase/reductase SDR,NAD(P)-binding domain,Short-chain dehydrogenase/reductase [Cinara cedri]|uniref:Short-chain dehydrogenase/reductase SDR,NAD(P)-binding domain,Short-chain dehydrogenase/reductase n=1 Tax=Cinara cedri TaxID=506608 RepID=A0A5E4MGC9_9HEMI|nr:Short-chain dehydrogenase/reductase SDR,NAD(P)-binding domain,Short-chain dehydrogenase/reductase [Cinara cedri]